MRKGVVIFVHGFMGSRAQFNHLLDIPYRFGWDSHAVILPGHESDINDFVKYRADDWQKHLDNCLNELRNKYSKIIIVTHSMGGLLAVNSYVECAKSICGILALSLPLHIVLTRRCIQIQLAILNEPSEADDICISITRQLSGVSGITLSNSIRLLPSGLSFLRLMLSTKRTIKRNVLPLYVVNSCSDELVSMKTVGFLKHNCPSAVVYTVRYSSHCYFCRSDKLFIESRLFRLLESLQTLPIDARPTPCGQQ